MMVCSSCGKEMTWKEGVSKKSGKSYAFWACSTKLADQTFCKGTAIESKQKAFTGELEKSNSQEKTTTKDEQITRCAIVNQLIASGREPSLETFKDAHKWFLYVMGRNEVLNALLKGQEASTKEPVLEYPHDVQSKPDADYSNVPF